MVTICLLGGVFNGFTRECQRECGHCPEAVYIRRGDGVFLVYRMQSIVGPSADYLFARPMRSAERFDYDSLVIEV